ncbi:MAG: TetR/AcrR family transcriptional regulator [Acholeplasmataceae bacterium]
MAKDPQIKKLMIEETKKIIEENGKVTIKDISERCYVNIASVNYYFGSKENLIFIVISEVLSEIKSNIIDMVKKRQETNAEIFLEEVIGYIYSFSVNHMGVLRYLFLADGLKEGQLSEFVRTFFTDPEFIAVAYNNLGKDFQADDSKRLQVKYMIIFSSFFMPLFFQIMNPSMNEKNQMDTFKDPEFKKYFIEQILKIIV